MVLELKAKHFKKVKFFSHTACPIARAAKEQFEKRTGVSEMVYYLKVGKDIYYHIWYGIERFERDLKKAKKLEYSDEVVRKIKLTDTLYKKHQYYNKR